MVVVVEVRVVVMVVVVVVKGNWRGQLRVLPPGGCVGRSSKRQERRPLASPRVATAVCTAHVPNVSRRPSKDYVKDNLTWSRQCCK